ncbi:MAG: MoxR family ATPase [Planctomycetes bacterium]|nr:MoxR family ATPase [Planctomycetota bacterium]
MDLVRRLADNVKQVFVGRETTVEHLLTALLAEGHLLIEDAPGVGKTTLAKALARSIDASFKRIQFTPDLLPSDIVGVSVFDQAKATFNFKPGPIFANVVLADEINRTNPRTQSSLLEAMSEPQVSVDGEPHALPRPFLVLATQNPHEFEGTYPLPESQLDRFLLRIRIGYPSPEQEREVLRAQAARHPLEGLRPVVTGQDVLRLQEATRHVRVDDAVLDYVVAIAQRSRETPELAVGVSPRGSLCLRRAAQALALVRGRDHVVPDDVKELVLPALAHRVVVGRGGGTADQVLDELVQAVPAPL